MLTVMYGPEWGDCMTANHEGSMQVGECMCAARKFTPPAATTTHLGSGSSARLGQLFNGPHTRDTTILTAAATVTRARRRRRRAGGASHGHGSAAPQRAIERRPVFIEIRFLTD
jgi:hypothetical protein